MKLFFFLLTTQKNLICCFFHHIYLSGWPVFLWLSLLQIRRKRPRKALKPDKDVKPKIVVQKKDNRKDDNIKHNMSKAKKTEHLLQEKSEEKTIVGVEGIEDKEAHTNNMNNTTPWCLVDTPKQILTVVSPTILHASVKENQLCAHCVGNRITFPLPCPGNRINFPLPCRRCVEHAISLRKPLCRCPFCYSLNFAVFDHSLFEPAKICEGCLKYFSHLDALDAQTENN
jgi:hypothetical protein